MEFGTWVPTHKNALVLTTVDRRTDWSLEYNIKYLQTAEEAGVKWALFPTRYLSTYGEGYQLDPWVTATIMTQHTKSINVITAVHPGIWHPVLVAKMGSTLDYVSGGRWHVNITSGWLKQEFTSLGEPWLDHDERYRRSEEFIDVLKGIWSQDNFDYRGDFYRIHGANVLPRPAQKPFPQIFQGGNSTAARDMGARSSDWYFMNGGTVEEIKEQIEDVRRRAAVYGRADKIKFALNAFAICRDTQREAEDEFRNIVEHMDADKVRKLMASVQSAGASTQDGRGMWANAKLADLIQTNEGFKPGLIGTADYVADRIRQYEAAGVNMTLLGFLHFTEEVEAFGHQVISKYN